LRHRLRRKQQLPEPWYRANAPTQAPAKLDAAIVRTPTKDALVGLGWKPAIAAAAAAAALGADATLERLIFEALRRCPQRIS